MIAAGLSADENERLIFLPESVAWVLICGLKQGMNMRLHFIAVPNGVQTHLHAIPRLIWNDLLVGSPVSEPNFAVSETHYSL